MKRNLFSVLNILWLTYFLCFNSVSAQALTNAPWASPGEPFLIIKDAKMYICSVGWPAVDSAGNHYFITAGHCFRDEHGNWQGRDNSGNGLWVFAVNNSKIPVGYEVVHTNVNHNEEYLDMSLVKMIGNRKLSGRVQHLPNKPELSKIGSEACLMGFHDPKPRCGHISQVGAYIHVERYPWALKVNVVSLCAQHGDSGGAIYNSNGALGILNAGQEGCGIKTFTPIEAILSVLRQQVSTLQMV